MSIAPTSYRFWALIHRAVSRSGGGPAGLLKLRSAVSVEAMSLPLLSALLGVLVNGYRVAREIWRFITKRSRSIRAAQRTLESPYLPLPSSDLPSLLLNPTYRVVPFRGRIADLEGLRRWCRGPEAVALMLWLAPAGAGKTRLAAEICDRYRRAGWVTGFVRGSPTEGDIAALLAAAAPLLIVVDRAEERSVSIAELVSRLTARTRTTRILLLARQASDWWNLLPQHLPVSDADAVALLATAEIRTFAVLGERDASEALLLFEDAVGAYVALAGRKRPPDQPFRQEDVEATPLMISIAALEAMQDTVVNPRSGQDLSRLLLSALLAREAEIWHGKAIAAGLDLDTHVLSRAVTAAVLSLPRDEDSAVAALRVVPDLARADDLLVRRVARWLHDLYPYEEDGWFGRLTPSRLEETLVGDVLGEVPALASVLFVLDGEKNVRHCLATLTRAARAYPAIEAAFAEVLRHDLYGAASAAIAVIEQEGAPLGPILSALVEQSNDRGIAEQVLAEIPGRGYELSEVRSVALQIVIEVAPEERRVELLMDLAESLDELGRYEDAVDVTREAISLIQRGAAAESRPTTTLLLKLKSDLASRHLSLGELTVACAVADEVIEAHEPCDGTSLARISALRTCGLAERDWGRSEEFLAFAERAASDARALVDKSDTREALAVLAASLTDVENALGTCGRYADAVVVGEDAVERWRALTPEPGTESLLMLSRALHVHATCLDESGDLPGARAATREAIAHRRILALLRPWPFNGLLADTLVIHASQVFRGGDLRDAVVLAEEAALLLRDDLSTRQTPLRRRNLAICLSTLASCRDAVGDHTGAAEAAKEAVEICQRLAQEWSGARNVADYGDAVTRASLLLLKANRAREALPLLRVGIAELRAATAAGLPVYPNLADLLAYQAHVLNENARPAEGAVSAAEAIALAESHIDPSLNERHFVTAWAEECRADSFAALRKYKAARQSALAAVRVYQDWGGPAETDIRSERAQALLALIGTLSLIGLQKKRAAETALAAAVEARDTLQELEAEKLGVNRHYLADAHVWIGHLSTHNMRKEGLDAYMAGISIYRQLIADGFDAREDLADALEGAASHLAVEYEDERKAQKIAGEAAGLWRELAQQEPHYQSQLRRLLSEYPNLPRS
jgi:hypothetical protein